MFMAKVLYNSRTDVRSVERFLIQLVFPIEIVEVPFGLGEDLGILSFCTQSIKVESYNYLCCYRQLAFKYVLACRMSF